VKNFSALPARPASPKILLIDRPGAPQSTIVGGELLPIPPTADIVPFDTANDVLAGTFLSRVNMDLRETKGWSYGVSGDESVVEHAVPYVVSAGVQADRTGDSLAALNQDITQFLTTKGVTQAERDLTVANSVQRLPGNFETSGSVLSAMMSMDVLKRPDNYYETLPARYRAQTPASLDQAARSALDPKAFTWIVVGDAAKVRPQLERLGMPIEVVEAP
jgi:predicted Zn-dependent peptidase